MESGRHLNIKILSNASLEKVEGEAGNFRVTILKRPRYVNEELCNACGTCRDYCPVEISDSYNQNLSKTKCLYIPYPQAVPASFVIDPKTCLFLVKRECKQCEQACKELKAINLNQKAEYLEIEVGSLILSPGFEEFDSRRKSDYGYGQYPNVLSSIEFERMLSASGPFFGRIIRPSDGASPKKIAFLQCVGSRDLTCQNPYCSSVCCTYAIKQSIIAKEHDPSLDITIFYMDVRTHGKGFESFFERAKDEFSINFIRSRASSVKGSLDGDLIVRFVTEQGSHKAEEFDLVVLSVGLEPPRTAKELAKTLGIRLNPEGFCRTHEFSPTLTSRPGIFVAGSFQGPKDIPESVTQASGSAALASSLLASSRGTLTERKEYPPELDLKGELPRIGVFVCHCGVNIAGVADCPEIKEYANTLDGVVYAEENLYSCSRDTQEKIKQMIQEHHLNRVVVAACTPRTHEFLFQETIREVGLNRCLFEMATIRDQCTWVTEKSLRQQPRRPRIW